jgi:hypothetical protein
MIRIHARRSGKMATLTVVKVDESGNKYSGKYTAAVYSVSEADPFDESVEVASGTGVMTGTRVKPD